MEGALFDLDGVLVDTESYQWKGWVEVLNPYGIALSKQDYISSYAGKTGALIEKELTEAYNLEVSAGSLLGKKENLLLDWFENKKIDLMPYARESLERVKSKGFKVAVVSGGPRKEVDLKLKKTGLIKLVDATATATEVQRGKPFPDVYLLGLEEIGLQNNQCFAVEDTQYGVEAAVNADLKCFAVPTEFSEKQDFSKAEKKCSNLKEVIDSILE